MKKEVKPIAGDILAILAKFSEGAGIEDISLNSPDTPRRTLQRWLENWRWRASLMFPERHVQPLRNR